MTSYLAAQKANHRAAGAPRPIDIATRAALFCILVGSWMLVARPLGAQAPSPAPAPQAQTHSIVVHGVVEQVDKQTHGLSLLNNLTKTDFRLFDNNHEVAIETFGAGANLSSPIALWLVVQCNLGPPDDETSSFMKGKTQFLKPALEHLNNDDLVGVAHWCDDGSGPIDVPLGTNVDAALQGIDTVLAVKPYISPDVRAGIGLQKMVQNIVASTLATTPARWPVMLFLNGDRRDTTDNRMADEAFSSMTATSGMIFGLGIGTQDRSPIESMRNGGELTNLIHTYCGKTGGNYYITPRPESFAQILDYILTQIHVSYTFSFEPPKLDSKPHDLRLELTKDAQKRFPNATLRFRTEYIPLPRAK